MKLRTYWITFAAFSMAQALRIAFPLNKDEIQLKYEVDDLFLAIMDVLYFIFYTVGACFHFSLVDRKNVRQTYLKFAILGTVSGCFFAYFSLFSPGRLSMDQNLQKIIKKAILIVNVILFGFSQFVVWPLNLAMVSEYYKPQTDGAMIGLWGSSWQLGNMLALLMSNFLVHSLKVKWQVTVLIIAAANITCALVMYFFLQNPKYQNNKNMEFQIKDIQREQNVIAKQQYYSAFDHQGQTQKQFWNFIKGVLLKKYFRVYLLINGVTSGLFIGFLYWIPIYMIGIGWKSISGYMTLIYEVFAILGSFFIGFLHQQHPANSKISYFTKIKEFLYHQSGFICTGASFIAILVWLLIDQNIVVYGILIGISGFFMGGLFNSMHSNDLFKYTKNDPLKTEMFAVLVLISNYIITSITSLLIGILIQFGHTWQLIGMNESQYKGLFYVLILLVVIDMILLIIKRSYERQRQEQTSQYIKLAEKNL